MPKLGTQDISSADQGMSCTRCRWRRTFRVSHKSSNSDEWRRHINRDDIFRRLDTCSHLDFQDSSPTKS